MPKTEALAEGVAPPLPAPTADNAQAEKTSSGAAAKKKNKRNKHKAAVAAAAASNSSTEIVVLKQQEPVNAKSVKSNQIERNKEPSAAPDKVTFL